MRIVMIPALLLLPQLIFTTKSLLITLCGIDSAFNGALEYNCSSIPQPPSLYCKWTGISCSGSNGPVTGIDYFQRDLSGTLATSLGLLTNLQVLSISTNTLSGAIPSELGLLTNLVSLSLINNQITGTLPTALGLLSKLVFLWLTTNQLAGSIPSQLGGLSLLQILDVGHNHLTGPIPPSLCSARDLKSVYLSSNIALECIPRCLVDAGVLKDDPGAMDCATVASAVSNDFEGLCGFNAALHGALGYDCSLVQPASVYCHWTGVSCGGKDGPVTEIVLLKSKLSGTLATSLGLLTGVFQMIFTSNSLTGVIPSEMGLMSSLVEVDLSHNRLTGTLPTAVGLLTKLTLFFVTNNHLSGMIPSQLGLLSNIQLLDLIVNKFTGSVPTALCLLSNAIIYINANPELRCLPSCLLNKGNGDFDPSAVDCPTSPPSQLPTAAPPSTDFLGLCGFNAALHGALDYDCSLVQPASVYCHWTGVSCGGKDGPVTEIVLLKSKLSGTLATSLGLLTGVFQMLFTSNSLTGVIPSEMGLMSSLVEVNLSHNRLTGTLPTTVGLLNKLAAFFFTYNHITGGIPSQLALLSNIEILDLLGNKFSGTIPTALCLLSEASIGINDNPGLRCLPSCLLSAPDTVYDPTATICPSSEPTAVPTLSSSVPTTMIPTLQHTVTTIPPTSHRSTSPNKGTSLASSKCLRVTATDEFGDSWRPARLLLYSSKNKRVILSPDCTDNPVVREHCFDLDSIVGDELIIKVVGTAPADIWGITWSVECGDSVYYGGYGTTMVFTLLGFDGLYTVALSKSIALYTDDFTCDRCPIRELINAGNVDSPARSDVDSVREGKASSRAGNYLHLGGVSEAKSTLPPVDARTLSMSTAQAVGPLSSVDPASVSTATFPLVLNYESSGHLGIGYHPKFQLTMVATEEPLVSGSLCGNGTSQCALMIGTGSYRLRITGGGEAATLTWSFCGVSGRRSTELHFTVEGDVCKADSVLYREEACSRGTRHRGAVLEAPVTVGGVLELEGAGLDALTLSDFHVIEQVLVDEFTDAILPPISNSSVINMLPIVEYAVASVGSEMRVSRGNRRVTMTARRLEFKMSLRASVTEESAFRAVLDESIESGLFLARVRAFGAMTRSKSLCTVGSVSLIQLRVIRDLEGVEGVSVTENFIMFSIVVAVLLILVEYIRRRRNIFSYELAPGMDANINL